MKNLIPRFIIEKNKENKFRGNFKATTMFIDISGFTAITQKLMINGKEGAEVLSDIINEIYTPSIKAVYNNNGFITTFAGDAFTSVFPYKDSKPILAFNTASKIQDIFQKIGKQKTKFGEFELSVKIGLSYGTVSWGILKGEFLNSYYFKGKAIDNCAASEHSAEKGEIIFDESVLKKIQNKVAFEKKSSNHILLKSILNADKQELQKRSAKQFPLNHFIPEKILKLKSKGEFRDIVSCFISFEETRNWKPAVVRIINLTETYGGYFNKIDFGDKGGNILVLFGAPVGKEKIYSRACGFAQTVKNVSGFNTRIGLTYGTVFAGFVGSELRAEYTALGMVVNLSARFMMKADFGEIYIDKLINKHINKKYETSKIKKQKFKGFKEEISVYTLGKKIEHKFVYEEKLIGRQKELQELKRTLKPIQNSKFGGIVYVHGIAGIGKSKLVNEIKQQIEKNKKQEYNWFYLPCDEILRKSFNPFTRFLKDYFEQSEENTKRINTSNFDNKLESIIKQTKDKEIKSELIRTKSILGAMVNLFWKNSLYEQLDAKGRFENSLYAVKNLIKAESLQKPVIIELEDGHWIDNSSLKLLKVLTRNVEKYPIIIITTCRLKDDGSLVNFDLKEVSQKSIMLEHLEKESSQKLIENKLNGKVSENLFELIWQKSEGNPFYIEQIILYLQENDLIDEKLNLTKKDIEIPNTINSIIIARIDRLTIELKELVQTASVLGREFSVNILSAMLNNKEINKELREGEKENIWNALTRINYIFKHALIRETVYEMQLKKQLKKLHKLAAETIENLYKDNLKEFYEDLANHFEKAEIEAKTIEYLQKAGHYEKRNYNNGRAIDFYERLLTKKIDTKSRIDTLHKEGNILELIGKWKQAERIFQNALKLSQKIEDKQRIAKLYGSFGQHNLLKGNYVKAMKYFEKRLKISEELRYKRGIAMVAGNMGNVCSSQGNYAKAMGFYEKALKISEELGYKRGISNAIASMGLIYSKQGNYAKAMEFYEKAVKTSEELGYKIGISMVVGNMGIIYYGQGNYAKAMEYNEKKFKISEKLGDKSGILKAVGNMGVVYKEQDNYAKAMECYEKALKISEELGYKRGISIVVGNMGVVYKVQGNYAKTMECCEKALKIDYELNLKPQLPYHLYTKSETLYKMREFAKAKIVSEESYNAAKEIDNKEYILSSNILKEKINFKLSDNLGIKLKSIENMKSMLDAENEEENIATLNYELAIMSSELKMDSSEYKKRAIKIYKTLYKKTPKIDYKNRIEELEK